MKLPTWKQIRCKLGFHKYRQKVFILRKVGNVTIGRKRCEWCEYPKIVRLVNHGEPRL